MITSDDLRRTLRSEAADAPDLSTIRAAVTARNCTHRNHRLRGGLAIAAAVAVVLAIAAGLSVSHRATLAGPRPSPAAHSTGFTLAYSFALAPLPGYDASERDIVADHQSVMFAVTIPPANPAFGPALEQPAGRVDVYSAGVYDPTAAQAGQPVTVSGHPGFFGRIPVQLYEDGSPPTEVPALAWEYAPNAWAVAAGLDGAHQTLPVESAFAAAIRPGTNPVLLPAELATVPDGLIRQALTVTDITGGLTASVTFKRPGTPSDAANDYSVTMQLPPPASPASGSGPTPAGGSGLFATETGSDQVGTVTAGGAVYQVTADLQPDGSRMYVSAAGHPLSIIIVWSARLGDRPDLQWASFQPATSLTPTDTSTWFDATTAIP